MDLYMHHSFIKILIMSLLSKHEHFSCLTSLLFCSCGDKSLLSPAVRQGDMGQVPRYWYCPGEIGTVSNYVHGQANGAWLTNSGCGRAKVSRISCAYTISWQLAMHAEFTAIHYSTQQDITSRGEGLYWGWQAWGSVETKPWLQIFELFRAI